MEPAEGLEPPVIPVYETGAVAAEATQALPNSATSQAYACRLVVMWLIEPYGKRTLATKFLGCKRYNLVNTGYVNQQQVNFVCPIKLSTFPQA